MAHRHPALHAKRGRPVADVLDREGAEKAAIVEVDVDVDASPLSDAEHDVEMTLGVPVEAGRIETSDEIGAKADRLVEKLGRSLASQNAALREGDKLNVDDSPARLADLQNGFERSEADRAVDHDVAAHLKAAVGDAKRDLIARPLIHRRGLGHIFRLKRDALMHVESVGARLMRNPLVAVEARIEMDMPLDETRRQQRAFNVDGRRLIPTQARRRDRHDAAVRDPDVLQRPVGKLRIGEKRFDRAQVKVLCPEFARRPRRLRLYSAARCTRGNGAQPGSALLRAFAAT